MTQWYQKDLAYIHDAGFSQYALQSAPQILGILQANVQPKELIVELGCGSGLLAEKLCEASYTVLGIDISREMIKIAQKRVPKASFQVGSLYQVNIPQCTAVVAVGEVLNYAFDRTYALPQLFARIYQALKRGGVFIFDIATLALLSSEKEQKFREGQDWFILVEKSSDLTKQQVTRRIITFRQIGNYYQKSEEVHVQSVYEVSTIIDHLNSEGFMVQISESYGQFKLPQGRTAFFAYKL